MFKKAKVVMISTNERSDIWLDKINQLHLAKTLMKGNAYDKNGEWQPHLLYILSDDEIQVDDWFINIGTSQVRKCDDEQHKGNIQGSIDSSYANLKKIIASTDTSLRLPSPSQGFIEKYVEEYNSKQ